VKEQSEASPDRRLVVLYLTENKQHWCVYCDQKEADGELELMPPGTVERGRIWVEEKIKYVLVPTQ